MVLKLLYILYGITLSELDVPLKNNIINSFHGIIIIFLRFFIVCVSFMYSLLTALHGSIPQWGTVPPMKAIGVDFSLKGAGFSS